MKKIVTIIIVIAVIVGVFFFFLVLRLLHAAVFFRGFAIRVFLFELGFGFLERDYEFFVTRLACLLNGGVVVGYLAEQKPAESRLFLFERYVSYHAHHGGGNGGNNHVAHCVD